MILIEIFNLPFQEDFLLLEVTAERDLRSFTNGAKTWLNVENCQFFKGSCKFLSVIWVKLKHSKCYITLPCSSTFYSLLIPFLCWRYLNSRSTYVIWYVFRQTFCFHFQIRMNWTAVAGATGWVPYNKEGGLEHPYEL